MNIKRLNWRYIVGLVLVLILSFVLEELGITTTDTTTDTPAPAPSNSQSAPSASASQSAAVYMTTPYLQYPDVKADRTPPPIYQALLADIAAAQERVDVAVFDIDLPELRDALVQAAQRGVTVRLVFDDENLEDARVAELVGDLDDAGIVTRGDERSPFMHSKFVVVDGQIVWTGSWNLTTNCTYRNNNNMLRIVNPTMAAVYHTEVEQLMAGNFGKSKESNAPHPTIPIDDGSLTFYFSPVDGINQHVVDTINQAKQSISFMAFSFTDDAIGQALIDAQARGVTVSGVVERQSANGTGSEYPVLVDAGIDVLTDGNCYIMHHKTIVVDERIVVTGSYNFTKSAEQSNDENLLIIDSPAFAREYLAEYARVRQQAEQPTQCGS